MDETASFLMEKLRVKSGTFKSFKEYAKSLRMTLLEKRYALEVSEKSYLQECLDLLQQNILVTTLPAIIERLEVISRHLGLKFVSGSSGLELFISSDMFYVEIILESNGNIKDVKIHHDEKIGQQNCEELKTTLEKRDFNDFTLQLEGLISIYNLNAEKKVKSKAFSSLQYLESDIETLFELQSSFMNNPFDIIHKSEVGLVQKRRGGHPMKIIYFISPYNLLDLAKKICRPLTLDLPEADYSISLCLESSSTIKLQTQSLVKIIKSEKIDENSLALHPTHIYEELSSLNTNPLPACFIMKLKERIPICESLINRIKKITEMDVNKLEGPIPILSLIKREIHRKHAGCDEDSSVVTLPDQRHCYIMTENHDMLAYIVQSIPFSHPSHISSILPLLRQQALFNTFISSCIRPRNIEDSNKKPHLNNNSDLPCYDSEYSNGFDIKLFFENEDIKDSNIYKEYSQNSTTFDITMFEIFPLSIQQITVSFEHPTDETIITVDLDLTDVSKLRCNISMASEDLNISVTNAEENAARALQKSFSIPVTMRALIRFWENQADTSDEEDINESSANNDFADMIENSDIHMECDNSKDNGECSNIGFNSNVIKIETSDNCDNFLNGFPTLAEQNSQFNAEEVFTIPNSSLNFQSFEPGTTNSYTSEPLSYLSNSNEQQSTSFEVKSEPNIDTVDAPFLKCKSGVNELFSGTTNLQQSTSDEIVLDSSSDSDHTEIQNKETAVNIKNPSPSSTNSSSEFSVLSDFAPEISTNCKTQPSLGIDQDTEVNDLDGVEQFIKQTDSSRIKTEENNSFSSPLFKGSSSVSITPLSIPMSSSSSSSSSSLTTSSSSSSSSLNNSNLQNVINMVGLDRRPQIDIFAVTPPSSLTITALPLKDISDDHAKNERKKLKNLDEKTRLEKKKKRKHDDIPMGPPEKIPAKSDPLTKSVSMTIKPTDSNSPRSLSPSNTLRKYPVSPTSSTSVTIIKSSNTSNINNNNNTKSSNRSLTGSPVQTCSPKLTSTNVSPKHSITSSPKNIVTGSSGKPSMSALKSAVTPPSSNPSKSNNEQKIKTHKESIREPKEKKGNGSAGSIISGSGSGSNSSNSGLQSPKMKSSNVKFKQIDVPTSNYMMSPQYDGAITIDPKLALNISQSKSKPKGGSLSTIIDKLKSQKHGTDGVVEECNSGSGNGKTSGSIGSSSVNVKEIKPGLQMSRSEDIKNNATTNKNPGEYVVKSSSSEGIKIAITKTRKDAASSKTGASKNSLSPGNGSPKHTGLKSGVTSGPASCKKPSVVPLKQTSSTGITNKVSSVGNIVPAGSNLSLTSSSSSKHTSSKSISGTFNVKSKSNYSPKNSSSSNISRDDTIVRKDKVRPISKQHSEKSIFSNVVKRLSPAQAESGVDEKSYKVQPPYQSPVVGNLIKHLDTNFQIPKISDRNKITSEGGETLTKKTDLALTDSNIGNSKETAKTEVTASPMKMFTGLDENRMSTNETTKSLCDINTNTIKSVKENNYDLITASQHSISTSNCVSTNMQSNDGLKLNLTKYNFTKLVNNEIKIIPDVA